jgi:dethiobiotin synthetase
MNGPRPAKVVVVAGTGTEVGKTWVSAALLVGCRAVGMNVAARKPVQSFEPGTGPTDAEILASASAEDPAQVCLPHRSYEVPFAPPMAAAFLELPQIIDQELRDEIVWPDRRADLGLVELAGGVASPLTSDRSTKEFVDAIGPDHILLVADAGLGVINAVRLSLLYLADRDGPVGTDCNDHTDHSEPVVVLNRFDPANRLHQLNARWLQTNDGLDVVTGAVDDGLSCARKLIDRIWPERAFVEFSGRD